MNRPEGLASLIISEWLRLTPQWTKRTVTFKQWNDPANQVFNWRASEMNGGLSKEWNHETLGGLTAQLRSEVPEFAGDVVIASFKVATVEEAMDNPLDFEVCINSLGWQLRRVGDDAATVISQENALVLVAVINNARQGGAR